MKKLVENFSGDYRIMRVIFSSSDPLGALDRLSSVSYKTFISYLEYLDAKQTLDEDFAEKQRRREQEESNRIK